MPTCEERQPFHFRYAIGLFTKLAGLVEDGDVLSSDTSPVEELFSWCCSQLQMHRDGCEKEKRRAEKEEQARAERAKQCAGAVPAPEQTEVQDPVVCARISDNFCAGGKCNEFEVARDFKTVTENPQDSIITKTVPWELAVKVMCGASAGVHKDSPQIHGNRIIGTADTPGEKKKGLSDTKIMPTCHAKRSRLPLIPVLFAAVKLLYLTTDPTCLQLLKEDAENAPTLSTVVMKMDPSPGDRSCFYKRIRDQMETRSEALLGNDNPGVEKCVRCERWAVEVTSAGFREASETACEGESSDTVHPKQTRGKTFYKKRIWKPTSPFCSCCGKGGVVILVYL